MSISTQIIANPTDISNEETKQENKLSAKEKAIQEYRKWFNDVLILPQYYEKFIAAGYENLSYLDEHIDEDKLINDIGINEKPHRRKILQSINQLVELRNSATTTTTNDVIDPKILALREQRSEYRGIIKREVDKEVGVNDGKKTRTIIFVGARNW